MDGPDYQDLPERARHLFLVLKLSFGPAGLEVHYPEALAHELAAKSGMPTEAVKAALDTLEAAGWIRRERNMIWIVGQLKHEPSLELTNGNHRKSIQRHVAGLPRLALVRAFIEKYAEWFEGIDSPTDGYPMASEGVSDGIPIGTAITEDRIPNTEDRTTTVDKSTGADAPADEPPAERPAANGTPPPKAVRAAVIPLIRRHLWLGNEPPPRVLESDPKWNGGREANVVLTWLKNGDVADLEEAEAVIRYARHALDMDEEPFSLKFLHNASGRGRFSQALGYARKQMATETEKRERQRDAGGPKAMGDAMEAVR